MMKYYYRHLVLVLPKTLEGLQLLTAWTPTSDPLSQLKYFRNDRPVFRDYLRITCACRSNALAMSLASHVQMKTFLDLWFYCLIGLTSVDLQSLDVEYLSQLRSIATPAPRPSHPEICAYEAQGRNWGSNREEIKRPYRQLTRRARIYFSSTASLERL